MTRMKNLMTIEEMNMVTGGADKLQQTQEAAKLVKSTENAEIALIPPHIPLPIAK